MIVIYFTEWLKGRMSDFQFKILKRPNVSCEVSCKVTRVVEQRLTVIRVMAVVTECILRWQRFLQLQLMLAMKKFMYVCMCVYVLLCTCGCLSI